MPWAQSSDFITGVRHWVWSSQRSYHPGFSFLFSYILTSLHVWCTRSWMRPQGWWHIDSGCRWWTGRWLPKGWRRDRASEMTSILMTGCCTSSPILRWICTMTTNIGGLEVVYMMNLNESNPFIDITNKIIKNRLFYWNLLKPKVFWNTNQAEWTRPGALWHTWGASQKLARKLRVQARRLRWCRKVFAQKPRNAFHIIGRTSM